MKKVLCLFMVVIFLFFMTGCGKTKTLHCDYCKKEITVKESSNMEEGWIIYCDDCNEELFGDDPILGDN